MISGNVMVAVRSIEIVTAEITMIRDNARKVFLESVIQIGTRLEEAKQMVPSGEWTAYLTDKLGYKPSTAQNYMRIAREFGGGQVSLTGKTAADAFGQLRPFRRSCRCSVWPRRSARSLPRSTICRVCQAAKLRRL